MNESSISNDTVTVIGEPLPGRLPTLRVVPMPKDLNSFGRVFGGWVMAQVDIAGGVAAMRFAGGRVSTVSVNSFQFKQPIDMGDLVSLYTRIVRIGTTSITVAVEVYAERQLQYGQFVKVTEAELTYVAVDESGHKRALPKRED